MFFNRKLLEIVAVISLGMSQSHSGFAALHIALEGNTGAGKTTLAAFLRSQLSASYVPEPFDAWLDVNQKGNLFQNFLQDGKEWSMYLALYSTITKIRSLQHIETSNQNEVILIDRSVLSDSNAFGKVHRDQELLSERDEAFYKNFLAGSLGPKKESDSLNEFFSEFSHDRKNTLKDEILTQARRLMEEGAIYKIDALIYLRTSASTCKERADFRDRDYRDADSGPVGKFYEKLGAAHDEWLNDRQEIHWEGKTIPVLIINGDVDFINDDSVKNSISEQVKEFVRVLRITQQKVQN